MLRGRSLLLEPHFHPRVRGRLMPTRLAQYRTFPSRDGWTWRRKDLLQGSLPHSRESLQGVCGGCGLRFVSLSMSMREERSTYVSASTSTGNATSIFFFSGRGCSFSTGGSTSDSESSLSVDHSSADSSNARSSPNTSGSPINSSS